MVMGGKEPALLKGSRGFGFGTLGRGLSGSEALAVVSIAGYTGLGRLASKKAAQCNRDAEESTMPKLIDGRDHQIHIASDQPQAKL